MGSSPASVSRYASRLGAVVFSGALCVACGHSAATQYLALRPLAPAIRSDPAPADPVRIVAVRVPAWLDRLEVARPTDGAAIKVEDFERWAAPVGDLARGAVTEDLADRLPGVQVLPAGTAAPPFTRDVSLELTALEDRGATLELSGAATITDAQTGALILTLPVRAITPAPADAEDEATALNRLLAAVADQLEPVLRASRTGR
jgi:uncharacterized lipoprotein YmbA